MKFINDIASDFGKELSSKLNQTFGDIAPKKERVTFQESNNRLSGSVFDNASPLNAIAPITPQKQEQIQESSMLYPTTLDPIMQSARNKKVPEQTDETLDKLQQQQQGTYQQIQDAASGLFLPSSEMDRSEAIEAVKNARSAKRSAVPAWDSDEQKEYNRLYEDLFAEQGGVKNPDTPLDWVNRSFDANSFDPNMTAEELQNSPRAAAATDDLVNAVDTFREGAIDDGTMDRANVTSNEMTRDRYIEYVEAGFGGRSVEELMQDDPGTVYNKQYEATHYGFKNYVPDFDTYLWQTASNLSTVPTRMQNAVANLRRDNVGDYSIKIDDRTISGKEFDISVEDYLQNESVQNAVNNENNYKEKREDCVSENPVAMTINGYTVQMDDGETESFTGGFKVLSGGYDENDEIVLYFPNQRRTVVFDNLDDYYNSVHPDYRFAKDGEPEDLFIDNVPDMIMQDGTALSYQEVLGVAQDKLGERDYGFGNWNNPNPTIFEGELFQDDGFHPEVLTNGGFHPENFLPWLTDVALGSSVYMLPSKIPAAITGLSNAAVSARNIDPRAMNYNGSAKLVTEDPSTVSFEDYLTRVGANALIPATEYIGGNIGGSALSKVVDRRIANPLIRYGLDIGEEGLEEIPGNAVEGLASDGLSGWYANPMLDENGDPIIDASGHYVLDPNTSNEDRKINFLNDVPEALLGGSALSGTLGLRSLVSEGVPYLAARSIAKNASNRVIRPEDIRNTPITISLEDLGYNEEEE